MRSITECIETRMVCRCVKGKSLSNLLKWLVPAFDGM